MPDLAPASRRAELEKRQAQDLMAALPGERLEPVDRPDADAYSHLPGKKPDFLFTDGKSQPHFVEVTRLLPSTLRRIHSFVQREICDPLVGILKGTYVLYISMADLPGSKIPEPVATAIGTCIEHELESAPARPRFEAAGHAVERVRADGSRITPWLLASDLPPRPAPDHPEIVELKGAFGNVLIETEAKFRSREGK